LSFDTISAFGPNGALPHYKGTAASNLPFTPGTLYLVDSGGQYQDGTTDITRTVPIGEPSAEMIDRFTRVLQGHIAIATVIFPKGTRGSQLDSFARRPLWEVGCDYAHGTGHGVGAFWRCTKGRSGFHRSEARNPAVDEPLQAGMIISNEPGYYKPGEYGIRIENLVLVIEKPVAGGDKETLGFETLTYVPIEKKLIDASMLSDRELDWLKDIMPSAGADRPAARGRRQGMARKAMRAALTPR
jgi:Xaa-Pro aminopeptidase